MRISDLLRSLDVGGIQADLRKLFTRIDDNFQVLKRALNNQITFGDNVKCDVITARFDSGVPLGVQLKNLEIARSGVLLGSSVPAFGGPSVQPGGGKGAAVTLRFAQNAKSVLATVVLFEEGTSSGTGSLIATANAAGLVKPDGTTVTIAQDGTISSTGGGGSFPVRFVDGGWGAAPVLSGGKVSWWSSRHNTNAIDTHGINPPTTNGIIAAWPFGGVQFQPAGGIPSKAGLTYNLPNATLRSPTSFMASFCTGPQWATGERLWNVLASASMSGTVVPVAAIANATKFFGVAAEIGVNAGKMLVVSGDGTNMSGLDTGIVVAANTFYNVLVDCSNMFTSFKVWVWVNGVLQTGAPWTKNTNIPAVGTTGLDLEVFQENNVNHANTFSVSYYRIVAPGYL